MVKLSKRIVQQFCTGVLMVVAGSAGAQSAASFPNKPVRIIIPSAPGNTSDVALTIYTERFAKELGQPFIFEHRPGGESIVAVTAGTKATPDGYTLFSATTTILINHWLYSDLQYDTLKDIALISPLTRSTSALVVNPGVANSLKEFIAYAKANPGKINMASPSSATVLFYQRFMNVTGTRLTVVNYKSPGQVIIDVMGGHVQGSITGTSSVNSLIKAGKLRGLAVGGDKRSPVIPDVPTFAEAGLKDYDAGNWNSLFAPGKTPRDIIEKLNAQIRRAQATPEVIDALAKQGLVPYGPMSVSQADELFRTELERFGKLIKESGLKAEKAD